MGRYGASRAGVTFHKEGRTSRFRYFVESWPIERLQSDHFHDRQNPWVVEPHGMLIPKILFAEHHDKSFLYNAKFYSIKEMVVTHRFLLDI